jgi:hypothetical protein
MGYFVFKVKVSFADWLLTFRSNGIKLKIRFNNIRLGVKK